MKYGRAIETRLPKVLKPNKVILLLGARRTGKTWFLKDLLPRLEMAYLFLNDDDSSVQLVFNERTLPNYKRLLGNAGLLVVDDAHRIPEIGWLEAKNGKLSTLEIKWNKHKKVKIPSAFAQAYPDASFEVISRDNYLSWIT